MNTASNKDARLNKLVETINKYTETSISPIDDKWEWSWRCKESEETFDTPEDAVIDCINFICREYEVLLVESLEGDEPIDVNLGEYPVGIK